MKTTFTDFLDWNSNCNKFANNVDAELVFEYLSDDDNIIKMIESADMGKPALAPVVKEVEMLIEKKKDAVISFDDNFTKQTVGLMVRAILKPFGYSPTRQKAMPKSIGAKKFTSASCYSYDPINNPPTLRVKKIIEKI